MVGVKAASGATRRSETKTNYPHQHLLLVAGLVSVVGAGLLLMPAGDVAANRRSIPIELPLPAPAEAIPGDELQVVESWRDIPVKSGDNLSLIFQRAGLDDGDVYHVVHHASGGKTLKRIYPGQTMGFQVSEAGELKALRHVLSQTSSVIYRRNGDEYTVVTVEREPQAHRSFASAIIKSSLFIAGQDAGMSQNLIMELANIFGGVIDFVLDPRQGDTFHVL